MGGRHDVAGQARLAAASALRAADVLVLALAPGVAQAAVGAGASLTFPSSVTVGQTGVPASVTVQNLNSGEESSFTNSVCNPGDGSPPCASPENGIVVVPSCGQLTAGQCDFAGADPGVFQVSTTGTGQVGSACAGTVFDVTVFNAATGAVRFTPMVPGAHVTLTGLSASCTIGFTFNVLKSPTIDLLPAPGTQTGQSTKHTQCLTPCQPTDLSAVGGGSSSTTVNRAQPAMATQASSNVALGAGTLTDTAALTGRVNPSGDSVTFTLYGPDDTTCTGAPVFTSSLRPITSGSATSAGFTPSTAGVYRWKASYSGDANNLPVAGACNDAHESTAVTPAATTIATTASANIVLGGTISDTATVSGRVSAQPGATVQFRLYAPGDGTCTGTPVFSPAVSQPVASGPVSSPPFTPVSAGTYRWVASYSGDANNAPVTGACNAASETVSVTPASRRSRRPLRRASCSGPGP